MRFAAVASANEAMVQEPQTEGNPSVDADESILHTKRRVDRTSQTILYITRPKLLLVSGIFPA
ncbi:MAG: hypothetical protein ABSD41_11730 [Candidatus Bathyarchaeia archaeon]